MKRTESAQGPVERGLADLDDLVRRQRRGMVRDRPRPPISLTHLHVLMVLDAEGAVPMHRLAESLACSMPNATGVVDRMEERGLVQRLGDDRDRRVVLVRLTDAGRRQLAEFETMRRHHMQRLLEAMPADEQRLCAEAFRHLRETAERLDPDAEERA